MNFFPIPRNLLLATGDPLREKFIQNLNSRLIFEKIERTVIAFQ